MFMRYKNISRNVLVHRVYLARTYQRYNKIIFGFLSDTLSDCLKYFIYYFIAEKHARMFFPIFRFHSTPNIK